MLNLPYFISLCTLAMQDLYFYKLSTCECCLWLTVGARLAEAEGGCNQLEGRTLASGVRIRVKVRVRLRLVFWKPPVRPIQPSTNPDWLPDSWRYTTALKRKESESKKGLVASCAPLTSDFSSCSSSQHNCNDDGMDNQANVTASTTSLTVVNAEGSIDQISCHEKHIFFSMEDGEIHKWTTVNYSRLSRDSNWWVKHP